MARMLDRGGRQGREIRWLQARPVRGQRRIGQRVIYSAWPHADELRGAELRDAELRAWARAGGHAAAVSGARTRRSRRTTRSPRRRAWRRSKRAATRSTPRAPPRWRWAWCTRSPRGSAAADSRWSTSPRRKRSTRSIFASARRRRSRPELFMHDGQRRPHAVGAPAGWRWRCRARCAASASWSGAGARCRSASCVEPAQRLAARGFPASWRLSESFGGLAEKRPRGAGARDSRSGA